MRTGGDREALAARVRGSFGEHTALASRVLEHESAAIADAALRLSSCLARGGKVLVCGNGGSAADAQHFAAELVGRFEVERPGRAALALTTDTSALTALGNDYGFEEVFARQVQALARAGDTLLCLTTSGSSVNVLRAMEAATRAGAQVILLTGQIDGPAPALRSALPPDALHVAIPSRRTARVQEIHMLVLHCLCELIDHCLPAGESGEERP